MIIILTQCYPPRVGGIENLVFNLSYHLSKFEKVVVLADQHNPISEIIFDKRFTQNLIIKRFGGFKFFRKRNKVRELKNIIKLKKVTAIIGDSWKSLEIAIQKIDNKKTPFLSLVHGNEIIIKNQKHHKRLLNTFSKVEKIICNSQFTKDLLKKINIKFNEVVVIHPGVQDFDKVTEERVDEIIGSPVLLTLARLEKRKGHELILRTISNLKKKFPNICYVIAGEGQEKKKLETIVKRLNISKNVIFVGSINDKQKKYIFKKTDIMVMPTLDETKQFSVEGFGISYIEAAMFAIPSIASDVGGTKEAVIHNETGIIIKNSEELEKNISELLENKNRIKELGQKAKIRAQNELSWDNVIREYKNLIHDLN